MFGVVTVNRSSVCVPGVTSPSWTLQKSAGRSSTRTIQLFCVALLSTMRSGNPLRLGTPLDLTAAPGAIGEVGLSAGEQAAIVTSVSVASANETECGRMETSG